MNKKIREKLLKEREDYADCITYPFWSPGYNLSARALALYCEHPKPEWYDRAVEHSRKTFHAMFDKAM